MAELPQERSPRYWLWGVAGWLALTALCLLTHLGSLETHLTERAEAALAGAGLTGQISEREVSFTGEIATLRGTVDDALVRERAADVVAGVRGVRRVENEIEVVTAAADTTPADAVEPAAPEEPEAPVEPTPSLRLPSLSAAVDGGTITLTGAVPSQDVADAWTEAATTAYGPGNVVDQLTVTEEVGGADWLAGAQSLRLLEAAGNGSMTVEDGVLAVTGMVTDEAARGQILAELTTDFPGLRIEDRLEIAPQASEAIAALDLSGVTFDTGSATITPESSVTLDEAVRLLATFPDVTVEVAGHTDADGSAAANLSLSQARADAVRAYLVENGIAPERITAVGYGESEPIADNATPAGKALNRRIEFVITEGT